VALRQLKLLTTRTVSPMYFPIYLYTHHGPVFSEAHDLPLVYETGLTWL